MNLYPAIDILAGRVVRLRQGEYDESTVYGVDPVEVAESFVAAGSTWVHVVDLDAAKSGDPVNRKVVGAICSALRGAASVQTGGGVRSVEDARELAALGAARVVMGSAAVRSPDLVDSVAGIIDVAVGLDHRRGRVALHGWTETSDKRLVDLLGSYPAASAFVVTDISRDGMLTGPDTDGLVSAVSSTVVPIIASGGVGTIDHVAELAGVDGLEGVIVGKAIYEGRFGVAEALAALGGGRRP